MYSNKSYPQVVSVSHDCVKCYLNRKKCSNEKTTTIKSSAIISFRLFHKFYGNSALENGSGPKQLPWQQEAWLLIF